MEQTQQILEKITEIFLRNVSVKDKLYMRTSCLPHYNKWVSTYEVAKELQLPTGTVRRSLTAYEKSGGKITRRRSGNWILWSVTPEGFEPHPTYHDYLIKL